MDEECSDSALAILISTLRYAFLYHKDGGKIFRDSMLFLQYSAERRGVHVRRSVLCPLLSLLRLFWFSARHAHYISCTDTALYAEVVGVSAPLHAHCVSCTDTVLYAKLVEVSASVKTE